MTTSDPAGIIAARIHRRRQLITAMTERGQRAKDRGSRSTPVPIDELAALLGELNRLQEYEHDERTRLTRQHVHHTIPCHDEGTIDA